MKFPFGLVNECMKGNGWLKRERNEEIDKRVQRKKEKEERTKEKEKKHIVK